MLSADGRRVWNIVVIYIPMIQGLQDATAFRVLNEEDKTEETLLLFQISNSIFKQGNLMNVNNERAIFSQSQKI